MQLAIALTPFSWLVILAVVILGGIAVRSAGARGWWVLAGIVALLVATNPSGDAHRDALRQEVRSVVRQEMDREAKGAGRIAMAAFQHFGGDAVVDLLLDVDHQNFIVFSRTTMDGEVVSVGVLGQVFVEFDLPRRGAKRPSPGKRSER